MEKIQISTTQAPAAIGPYSQAIRVGQFLYTSGQIALDQETGQLVGSDIRAQTEQVIHNVEALLKSGGSSLQHVIKTTVFLVNMNDFAIMNEIYAQYFGDIAPARSTVAVRELPRKALVEIECIALSAE
jgi:2-iminobutanoate/2-iminopropanoate deaminase